MELHLASNRGSKRGRRLSGDLTQQFLERFFVLRRRFCGRRFGLAKKLLRHAYAGIRRQPQCHFSAYSSATYDGEPQIAIGDGNRFQETLRTLRLVPTPA